MFITYLVKKQNNSRTIHCDIQDGSHFSVMLEIIFNMLQLTNKMLGHTQGHALGGV